MNEEEIFHEALARNLPEERAAYLEQACAGNLDLRASVDGLLRANVGASGFLGNPISPLAATLDEPVVERPGTVIGQYKLLEQIGEGGFGVVFMAEQTHPVRRRVALKVLKPGMDTRQVVARFEAERQALAIMDHPNIAKVHDGGATLSGRPYFVMELVKGAPITEFCNQNHLTPRQRLELFVPVCQAVQHAHQKGIIHRDLKPSNVLVTVHDTKPVVKVIDFGVAKALGQELTDKTLFTGFAQMIGTPLYMSPEQAGQSGLDIDTRSDIYSLGVLLYELLTGTTPFDKERFKQAAFDEIRRIIREEEPPRPSTRLSASKESLASISAQRQMEPAKLTKLVRGELDWIVMKCLEKDRNRRYETANGLAHDIERYLHDEPVEACPPSAGYRLRKALRKHRVMTALLALGTLAGLALVGLAVGLIYNQRLQNANSKLETAVEETQQQKGEAESQRRRAEQQESLVRRLLYLSRINMADRAWHDANIARMDELLQEQRPRDADQEDLRGFEWHYLWRLRQSAHLTLQGHTQGVNCVSYSRDGKYLASASIDLTIKIWDAVTGREVRTLKGHGATVTGVAFSPDGQRLASASGDQTVKLWDVEKGVELLTLKGHTNTVLGVAFSLDGQRLASASGDQTIKVWDFSKWQAGEGDLPSLTLTGHNDMVQTLAFSPDGRRIVSGSGVIPNHPGEVKVWDAHTGQEVLKLNGHRSPVRRVAWSPDGKRLASASADQTVKVWDAETGKELMMRGGHVGWVVGLAYSPDSKRLASAAHVTETVSVWDAQMGQQLLTIKTGPVGSLVFSPDGQRLATASGDLVKVWDAQISPESRILWGHNQAVECVVFSPDSKRLASASWDGTVQVWDARTGEKSLKIRAHDRPVENIVFSPDGRRIATGSADHTAKVWDARKGDEIWTLTGHSGTVWGVAYSPDGNRLASASSDQTIKVWNAQTGVDMLTLRGHTKEVWGVAFSPDGLRLASSACDHTIKVWNAQTGAEVMTMNGHTREVTSVVYSPDGRLIASSGNDHTVKMWDAQTGKELQSLKGHTGAVTRVAFSPDGKRLASASEHHAVKIWDVQTGEEALTLNGHTDSVQSVAFSPDGKRLASAAFDHSVRIWDATLGDEPKNGTRIMPASNAQKHPDELKGVKSQNADSAATILFINTSKKIIKIFWLDYDGRRQLYQIMDDQPIGDGLNWPCHLQQTCVTHPWLISDEHDNAWHVFIPPGRQPDDSGFWTLEVLGNGNVKAAFQKVRNPFNLPDVPDPDGADVQKFAATVKLDGGPGDANAIGWPQGTVAGVAGSIDGDWATRWNGGGAGAQWVMGAAVVKIVGDRFYFLHRQNCTFLIEAKRVGKDRLVGRYVNLEVPTDSYPWVGHIVDHERIDGVWTHGRWDLRRKIGDKSPAPPVPLDAVTNSFRQGYEAMTKGEYDRAIAFYTETVRLDPKHYQAYSHRAVAYYNKGDVDRAIADNTRAIEALPTYSPAYRNRGREYGEQGKHDLAIADFTQALKLEPEDASAYSDRGWNYLQKRVYARSIADSTEAIRLNAKLVEPYRNRANAYRALGEVKKADEDERKAKELTK